MDTLSPPIETRTTKQLLLIAGNPEEWTQEALFQALEALKARGVTEEQIKQAKYSHKKNLNLET
ncbi:hypothetical protein [Pedobacter sandarakinus]|uniref:hypothetical protein n=1 Tax=Pedobacter sandarakinus TaxID=353156 RepID=UPI0022466EED|nr:hypothetical protein [Pedobacter sandarakinus]MCX2575489.1 hypothetical protein [Pedobacter sandarakinus]